MQKAPKITSLNSLYIPAQKGSEKLLLVMHGLGDSIDGYRFLPDALGFDDLHYLLLNAPDPYFTGYSWFDLYGDITSGIIRSRALLFQALFEIEGLGWDLQNVGVFGFSQGCVMALDLACQYPKTLGAIVGISGFVGFLETYPEKLSPVARNQRILMTHGLRDPMVPIHATRKQVQALKGMGLDLDWREYQKDHTIEPHEEIPDIRYFLTRSLALGH